MVAVDSRLKLKTDRFPQAKLRFPAASVRSIGGLVRIYEYAWKISQAGTGMRVR